MNILRSVVKKPKKKLLGKITSCFYCLYTNGRRYPEGSFDKIVISVKQTHKEISKNLGDEEARVYIFEILEGYINQQINGLSSSINAINLYNKYKSYKYLELISPNSGFKDKYSELGSETLEKLREEMFGIVLLLYAVSLIKYPFDPIPNEFWNYYLKKFNYIDWNLLDGCEFGNYNDLNNKYIIIYKEKFPKILFFEIESSNVMGHRALLSIANNFKVIQKQFGILTSSQIREALEVLEKLEVDISIEKIFATAANIIAENNRLRELEK